MKLKAFLLGAIIIILFWFLLPAALIMLNSYLSLPVLDSQLTKILGIIMFSVGLFLTLCIVKAHLLTGRVTPVAVEPPNEFIVKGFYKFTRNPMYLAILFTFLGGFFMFGHLFKIPGG